MHSKRETSWLRVLHVEGCSPLLIVAVSITLAFTLAGGALYFGLPAFRRRVDYVPVRIRALILEQQRRRHPPTIPTPAPTASRVQLPAAVQRLPTATPRPSPTPTETVVPPSPTFRPSPTPTLTVAVATPTRQATLSPTPTVMPSLTPSVTPSATPTPTPGAINLSGVQHVWQDWNNCGPATFAMALSYYGRTDTQQEVRRVVRPNKWDLNVSPYELAAYVRSTGLEVLVREGGTIDLLKRFLDNGIPVVLELWYYPDEHGGGHYRLVVGYDEAMRELIAYDVHWGPDYHIPYAQQEQEWQVFNRLYVVIYRPEQAARVREIVGAEMDDAAMYRQALKTALAERDADPGDAFAWFNVGTNYTGLGDYPSAAAAFDQARIVGLPFRMLWYQFGPYEAYLAVERYQDVIDLAVATLDTVGNQEESHYYLGRARQAMGDLEAARACYLRALQYHPDFPPALEALASLK